MDRNKIKRKRDGVERGRAVVLTAIEKKTLSATMVF